MKTVTILGSGCSKCRALEQRLQALKEEHALDFHLVKVTDLDTILDYGIMMTPGLVIDEVLRSIGSVPSNEKLLQWLKEQ